MNDNVQFFIIFLLKNHQNTNFISALNSLDLWTFSILEKEIIQDNFRNFIHK